MGVSKEPFDQIGDSPAGRANESLGLEPGRRWCLWPLSRVACFLIILNVVDSEGRV